MLWNILLEGNTKANTVHNEHNVLLSIIEPTVYLFDKFRACRLSKHLSSDACTLSTIGRSVWHFCLLLITDRICHFLCCSMFLLPHSDICFHFQCLNSHPSLKKKKNKKNQPTVFLTISAECQRCQRRHNGIDNLHKTQKKKKLNILHMYFNKDFGLNRVIAIWCNIWCG